MTENNTMEQEAFEYIKKNKKKLIEEYARDCATVNTPVTLFMAGSPGAGKTEVSEGLVRRFKTKPMRIDADEIRKWCPEYTGYNAHVFQKAATKGVHILFDYAIRKKRCHVILDGTFAYANALENIQNSLKRDRKVEIWFVHQHPQIAWEFTVAREAEEQRRVGKETFIKTSLASRDNAKAAKNEFGKILVLNLLIKNADNTDGELYLNIQADELDHYIPDRYTEDELNKMLI